MLRLFIITAVGFCLVSCADQEPKKTVGPVSNSTQLPWNMPQKGMGGGQFGMLPQNQYRR